MTTKIAADALTAELYAADIARHLALIARSQHRIAVALASEHRQAVLAHLRDLGCEHAARVLNRA